MRFSFVLLSLALTSAVSAKHHHNGTSTSAKSLCHEMSKLEKFVDFAANDTKVASKTDNNATKIAEVAAKASSASAKLTTLQSNSTLLVECAAITQKSECKKMTKLQKIVDTAANSTKLAEKTKGNSTKEAEFQKKAAKAQTKLDALTSNSTFVSACEALTSSEESQKGSSTTSSSSTASSTSDSSSAASANFGSSQALGLSTILAVAVGMMML